MLKTNQSGFTHLAMIAVALVIITGTAFAGYKIIGSSSANRPKDEGSSSKLSCTYKTNKAIAVGRKVKFSVAFKNGSGSVGPVYMQVFAYNDKGYGEEIANGWQQRLASNNKVTLSDSAKVPKKLKNRPVENVTITGQVDDKVICNSGRIKV